MFESWRNKHFKANEQIKKLSPILEEINSERGSKIGDKIMKVLTEFMGGINSPGLLVELGKKFDKFQCQEWICELEELLKVIQPSSPFVNKLMKNNDLRIILPEKTFPQTFSLAKYDKERKYVDVREGHKGYSVVALDAYFILLVNAIYLQQASSKNASEREQLFQDDFYSSMCRNPLLILLRKNLEYFQNNKVHIQKLIGAIKIYMMDEIVDKYEKQTQMRTNVKNQLNEGIYSMRDILLQKISPVIRRQPLKYRLKQNHLLCIFLAIRFATEYFLDLKKYVLGICENYSAISPNDKCLYALIRVWMFSVAVKDSQNMEFKVIDSLRKSNSREGWFELERYSIQKVTGASFIGGGNAKVIQFLFQLFEKDSHWNPNCTYIYSLSSFFWLLQNARFYSNSLESSKRSLISDMNEQSKEEMILKKIMERINKNLPRIMADFKKTVKTGEFQTTKNELYNSLSVVEEYFTNFSKSKKYSKEASFSNFEFKAFTFQHISDTDLVNYSKKAENHPEENGQDDKVNLVTYYRRQPKEVWEVPLQYNESTILYYLFYMIAKGIDLITPGRRKSPWLNIRFLASPINFFILLLVLVVVFKFLL